MVVNINPEAGWFVQKLKVALQLVLLAVVLAGCSSQGFRLQNIAKTDIDSVADLHYQHTHSALKQLTIKLYKRNPSELKHGQAAAVDQRLRQIFGRSGPLVFDELSRATEVKAMELALADGFRGDRVFALMVGLTSMIRRSYGYKPEFFVFDELNQQQLYNSARNVEIAAWRLANRRNSAGIPLILSNSMPGEPTNLSFERLMGKLISAQDMMAEIMAQKNQRVINKVAQNVATMAFFPL